MVPNQKGGTKCPKCETEKLGYERKLNVSVSADGGGATISYRIGAGYFKFGA